MSSEEIAKLDTLSLGFRGRFLTYDELTKQVRAWADAFPQLCRVTSIGRTPEGRELWLLTLGCDPDRARPSAWVDGNMHASELCGSSVALAIAEDVLRLHLLPDGAASSSASSAVAAARLRDVRFYVLPRMSPDGAEAVLANGRYVRSVPRDDRPARAHAYWRCDDVDGDGLALTMRIRDAGGEMVESPDFPGLLLPRTIDDPPPYYKVYPEGVIENFDGANVPTPQLPVGQPDRPQSQFPVLLGAGLEAGGRGGVSAERGRVAVGGRVHHAASRDLPLAQSAYVRRRVHSTARRQPDAKMNQEDLALYRQLGAWAEELTGYPMVSGCEEFLYEPDTPLHGDLTDYAYHQRGAVAYVVELWDLFKQVGFERKKRFVDNYVQLTPADMHRVAVWDRDKNSGRVMRPWRAFKHPQLGDVEVGGIDPRVGMWNPPPEEMPKISARIRPRITCVRQRSRRPWRWMTSSPSRCRRS